MLPLTTSDPVEVGTDEHLELRDTMNDILLDLLGDSDLIGQRPKVAEITGDRDSRLRALEALSIRKTD